MGEDNYRLTKMNKRDEFVNWTRRDQADILRYKDTTSFDFSAHDRQLQDMSASVSASVAIATTYAEKDAMCAQ